MKKKMRLAHQGPLLFIVDPIETLKPESDTSLALMRAALGRGLQVVAASASDLFLQEGDVFVEAQTIENFERGEIPRPTQAKVYKIEDFKVIFIRKDPPFDESYVRLCWLLKAYENRVRFLNSPQKLLQYHEKLLPFEGYQSRDLRNTDLLPGIITADLRRSMDYVNKSNAKEFILKSFLGFAGHDVHRISKVDFAEKAGLLFERKGAWILQPLQEEIFEKGDRRVFFLFGRYVGDFVRIPKEGSVLSNLAQGGRAELRSMNKGEKALVRRIEIWIQKLKIDMVGADFIAGRLSEVNITSPTGFLTYEALTGKNLSEEVIDEIV